MGTASKKYAALKTTLEREMTSSSSLTIAAVVVLLLTLCLVEALKLKSSGGSTVGFTTRSQQLQQQRLQSRKTNTFLANSYLDTLDKPNNNKKGSSGGLRE
jgi:hypothetical protein